MLCSHDWLPSITGTKSIDFQPRPPDTLVDAIADSKRYSFFMWPLRFDLHASHMPFCHPSPTKISHLLSNVIPILIRLAQKATDVYFHSEQVLRAEPGSRPSRGVLTGFFKRFDFGNTCLTHARTRHNIPIPANMATTPGAAAARPRILFIDAHDSFSNNIVALLTSLLGADVSVLPIGSPHLPPAGSPELARLLRAELAGCAAVVCGPGPGSPDNDADVGLMRLVWDLPDADVVPALGVCLGFQSMVAHYCCTGGGVRRLRRGLHGMVRAIEHAGGGAAAGAEGGGDIFRGVGPFRATLYHSLGADVGQDGVAAADWDATAARWRPLPGCPDVVPLAWVKEERGGDGGGAARERILMAARHARRPFWGLQYHPESVCTEAEGDRVVANWFAEAMRWNRARGRVLTAAPGGGTLARSATRPSLLSRLPALGGAAEGGWWVTFGLDHEFQSATVPLPGHVLVPDIVEALGAKASEQIVLDSANADLPAPTDAVADVRGRYSIIALDVADSLRIEYHTGDDHATASLRSIADIPVGIAEKIPLDGYGSVWNLLADFQDKRRLDMTADFDTPFMGGFMGYITYEQGLEGIGVKLHEPRGHHRPDICLAWITRSIVIDHRNGLLHVQQLKPRVKKEDTWLEKTTAELQDSCIWQSRTCPVPNPPLEKKAGGAPGVLVACLDQEKPRSLSAARSCIVTPPVVGYEDKVRACQEFIAAGDSYELCLTSQTKITRPRSDSVTNGRRANPRPKRRRRSSIKAAGSWQLFKALRARQPAPFASYLRLGGATLVSASPERFLLYDGDGLCSMRPMKGTVRKSGAVRTLRQAEEILHVPKEEAENLMIVDLVRHDLHGICGSGNVSVPHLMKVEEYQSVFQMITVVEGRLPRLGRRDHGGGQARGPYTGLDVLAASLPPGSMTGAPKKRSCEILQQIEERQERSLYSGVVGYMCASGRGDWSVTIRSMFRWDDEKGGPEPAGEPLEVWRIGAGGAVTILSTPEGEREEMFTKLAGPLGVFTDLV